jgi:hypothetical protein
MMDFHPIDKVTNYILNIKNNSLLDWLGLRHLRNRFYI